MKFRIAAGVVLAGILLAGIAMAPRVLDGSAGGGWSHQGGEAWDAERMLMRAFGSATPNLALLVDPVLTDLDDPAVATAVADMSEELAAHTAITQVESYWSLGGPDSYATEDGAQGLVAARIGGPESGLAERARNVLRQITYDDAVIDVSVGGSAMVVSDARRASMSSVTPLAIAFVASLALVLLFLRSLAATGLVFLASSVAVSITVGALWAMERLTTVSTTAVVIALAVAWGTATAGGFVFAHRFLAERRAGAGRNAAVVATVGSAGRTVGVAAVVSAAVMLSQAVLPTAMIRSIAFATTVAVLAAGVAGVLVLGLLVSLFGGGVGSAGGMFRPVVKPGLTDRIARLSVARPAVTVVVTLLLLGGVSVAALSGITTGETTAASLPESSTTNRVARVLEEEMTANEIDAPFVIGPFVDFGAAPEQLAEYTGALSEIEGVARADSTQGSFTAGAEVTVPEAINERLDNPDANLVRAPLSAPADSTAAGSAVDGIEAVNAPFRGDVGGTTARNLATVAAFDSRIPIMIITALVAAFVLAGWLLRGWRVAARLVVGAVLSAAGALLAIRLGFVEGILSGVLGSAPVETLDAFAGPVAWAVGLALVAGWMVLAWGAGREAFDVTEGAAGAPVRSLAATRWTHLGAAMLLWLPFLGLAVNQWRSQQIVAVGVVGAGVVAATVGRFVLMPALFALAPRRLWPRRLDGTVEPMYPQTAAAAWLAGAVEEVAPTGSPATGVVVPASSDEDVTEWQPVADIGDETDLEEWARAGVAGVLPAAVGEADAGGLGETPGAAVDDDAARQLRRRRSRWRRPSASAADDTDVAEASEFGEEDVSAEAVAMEAMAPVVISEVAGLVVTPEVAEEEAPAVTYVVAEADTPVASADPDEAARPPAEEERSEETDGTRPEPLEATAAEPVDDEPEADPSVADDAGDDEAEPVAPAAAELDDEQADDGTEVPDPVAAVDVISLTESVIASLEADIPFTTEIGSGFVSNPSNNLSRVMEAILRDASRRGGDEVLVYGHASAGRYRWMVVDSGPRADHDPERARTLAEAQRFIRRVGGVVECRPEGDFTVFVVEIPMAS